MIPGRSAGRAARRWHAVIGFASAIDALAVGAAGALSTRLTLNLVPEPGSLIVLGPDVVGLALLGRRRTRSQERDSRMGSRDAASESKGFAR